jgi:hypothetical protein
LAKSVKNKYAPFVVKGHIASWLKFSNEVLANSCIPMRRTLSEVVYVDDIVDGEFQDINLAHDLLEYFQPEKVKLLTQSSNNYYGVVFSTKKSNFEPEKCGQTNVAIYPKFFILDLSCPPTILEHELGHLVWANHDMDTLSYQVGGSVFDLELFYTLEQQSKIKPYSYGYLCGGRGTVMSYADVIHPFYSNPDITYDGISCGNKRYANNSKVLRDYSLKQLAANKLLHSDSIQLSRFLLKNKKQQKQHQLTRR